MAERVGDVVHVGSLFPKVLAKYGIFLTPTQSKLLSPDSAADDVERSLNELFKNWHKGTLNTTDLVLQFELIKSNIMADASRSKLKTLKKFLKSLPRWEDSRYFKNHLEPQLKEIEQHFCVQPFLFE